MGPEAGDAVGIVDGPGLRFFSRGVALRILRGEGWATTLRVRTSFVSAMASLLPDHAGP